MSGIVHPNPGLSFPVLCALEIWPAEVGRSTVAPAPNWSMQSAQNFFSRFNALGSPHSGSCPSCCSPASPGGSTPFNSVIFSSNSSTLYNSTVQFHLTGLSSATTVILPTLTYKHPIPLCISFLCNLRISSCFWLFSYTSCLLYFH